MGKLMKSNDKIKKGINLKSLPELIVVVKIPPKFKSNNVNVAYLKSSNIDTA